MLAIPGILIAAMSSTGLKSQENYILPRNFYARQTDIVAKDLLGRLVVHKTKKGILSAKIVETEAYFGNGSDPASHAYRGPTPRSSIMFGEPGHAYVYFNYGVHWLLNFVAKKNGHAGAVLIRAVQPVEGIEAMLRNRPTKASNLTNGPGKLTKALGIDGSFNGLDLTDPQGFFYVSNFLTPDFTICKSKRVGINKGQDLKLRFYIKDNACVSR